MPICELRYGSHLEKTTKLLLTDGGVVLERQSMRRQRVHHLLHSRSGLGEKHV